VGQLVGRYLSELSGDSPYTVMFGPDKCGGTNKAGLGYTS
jgi:hypothetical protein